MNATLSLQRYSRLAFLSLSAAAIMSLGGNVHRKIVPALSLPTTNSAAANPNQIAPQLLPFTFNDVVRYFQDALGYLPQQRFANQVVFHGSNTPDEFYTITVMQRGPDVLVNFNVVDDYGMQLVREFFEAPFFLRFESEQFYSLLSGDITRTLHMGRFDVFFQYSSPGLEANISMIFSPRMRALSPPDP